MRLAILIKSVTSFWRAQPSNLPGVATPSKLI
jgi:hypothetical protein